MPRAHGVEVTILENGDLELDGLGVVENPLRGKLTLMPIDVGKLWFDLWAQNQHNEPNSKRIQALIMQQIRLSVSQVVAALKESSM